MLGPGCLIALVLPLGGAALGHWLDGTEGSMQGFAIGLAAGCVLAGLFTWILVKMRSE